MQILHVLHVAKWKSFIANLQQNFTEQKQHINTLYQYFIT